MGSSQTDVSALGVELLQEQLLQAPLPLEYERPRAVIEAQPGASADAFERLGVELEIHEKYRLERLEAVLIRRVGHERSTRAVAQRGRRQLSRRRRHFPGQARAERGSRQVGES